MLATGLGGPRSGGVAENHAEGVTTAFTTLLTGASAETTVTRDLMTPPH